MQKYALQFLVLCVAFYPLVVFTDIIPLDWLYDKLQLVLSLERVNSLYFRFSNEQEAVEYLGPRIMIGFGGLGRAALDGLITDGTWLVWTLRFGFIFWMFHVLLHTLPLFKKNLAPSLNNELTLLSILPVIILVDQIPNSSWSLIWIWFFSGALWGYSSNLYKRRR